MAVSSSALIALWKTVKHIRVYHALLIAMNGDPHHRFNGQLGHTPRQWLHLNKLHLDLVQPRPFYTRAAHLKVYTCTIGQNNHVK